MGQIGIGILYKRENQISWASIHFGFISSRTCRNLSPFYLTTPSTFTGGDFEGKGVTLHKPRNTRELTQPSLKNNTQAPQKRTSRKLVKSWGVAAINSVSAASPSCFPACSLLAHTAFKTPSQKTIGKFGSFELELPVLLTWCPAVNTVLSLTTQLVSVDWLSCVQASGPKFGSVTSCLTCRLASWPTQH